MPVLISPGWALGALLASIYATAFHVWQGESLSDLPRFLIAAWVGFALGQWGGQLSGLTLIQIGTLNLVSASLGAGLALLIARHL
jgi:hypothetical protein